jgi:hypothetical protein
MPELYLNCSCTLTEDTLTEDTYVLVVLLALSHFKNVAILALAWYDTCDWVAIYPQMSIDRTPRPLHLCIGVYRYVQVVCR